MVWEFATEKMLSGGGGGQSGKNLFPKKEGVKGKGSIDGEATGKDEGVKTLGVQKEWRS